MSVIYAASGNATDLDRFKIKAAANIPPIIVVTKWDLLSEAEGTALSAFHWDQQALVDLEILWRCSKFGGLASMCYPQGKAAPSVYRGEFDLCLRLFEIHANPLVRLLVSSFSFAVAMSRTAWMNIHDTENVIDPWDEPRFNQDVAFANHLSKIVGRNQFNEERCRQGCWS